MSPARLHRHAPALARRWGGCTAFTLIECMLVLVIVGNCIWMGLTFWHGQREHDRIMAAAWEIRAIHDAFSLHLQAGNAVPPSSVSGVAFPEGMDAALAPTTWRKGSPWGGRYSWVSPCPNELRGKRSREGSDPAGVIYLTGWAQEPSLAIPSGDFTRLCDEINEDGRFRGTLCAGFNGWPVVIVYP